MANSWKLAGNVYQLAHAELNATLPLRGMAPGLRKLRLSWAGRRFSWPGPLLAVRTVQAAGTAPFQVGFHAAGPGHRLRNRRLDVQMDESKRCPTRLQIYWGTTRPRQIDMEVLVSTAQQFEWIELLTWSAARRETAAPHSECLVRLGTHRGRWIDVREALASGSEWIVVPRDQAAAQKCLDGREPPSEKTIILPPFRLPVVCYRPAGQSWSYVEMSHPQDCVRVVARRHRGNLEWGFGLFGLDIEKGVILRGRARGKFVSRRGDTIRAERLFENFIAEPPHLSV